MRRILGLATVFLFAACAEDSPADPCVMRVDVIAPEPVRLGGTRVVEVDVIESSGFCASVDKEIRWATSNSEVLDITSSNQTSATIVARRVSSATISAWLISMPTARDSVSITVGPIVDQLGH